MSEHLYLSDFYGDKEFVYYKGRSLLLAEAIARELPDTARSLRRCLPKISFALVPDSQGGVNFKLRQSKERIHGRDCLIIKFCGLRICPLCQYRKSALWHSRALRAIPKILQAFPEEDYSFLLLTFTVRNPPILDMRLWVDRLLLAWENMARPYVKYSSGSTVGNPGWPFLGAIRTCEVTAGDEPGCFHPHIHALCVVKNSDYFGTSKYLDNWRLAKMAQHYLDLDYPPIVDIRKIWNIKKGFCESLKYAIKPDDLISPLVQVGHIYGSNSFPVVCARQLFNAKLISTSGVLRPYFKQVESNDSMIYVDETVSDASGIQKPDILIFEHRQWNVSVRNQFDIDGFSLDVPPQFNSDYVCDII